MLTLSPIMRKSAAHRLNNLKMEMIADAIEKHGPEVTHTDHVSCWDESFTEFNGSLYLWYNTPDHSTHAMKRSINN